MINFIKQLLRARSYRNDCYLLVNNGWQHSFSLNEARAGSFAINSFSIRSFSTESASANNISTMFVAGGSSSNTDKSKTTEILTAKGWEVS
jgi:hypothetical protein